MKYLCTRLLGLAVLGASLAATPGCVFKNSDMVITEKVCVFLEEYQTTGTFESFVVCDQFKTKLLEALDENDLELDEVKRITMKEGTFKTYEVEPHDWRVTADINIARQDVPDGPYDDGPESFVTFEDQSLRRLMGRQKDADLHHKGVKLVNRALDSLLDGEDPRLILIIDNESVEPEPSETDPLQFTLKVCVEFQIVVKKKHHGHGGHR
jgi:hypothetical protein